MPDDNVLWDRPALERFKRELRKHKQPGEAGFTFADSFTFEGHEYLVGYARYLVEYLEQRLAK